jgi:hypothetical protein
MSNVKKEGWHQKFRPERPRRTIQTGRLHDVQCRPPSLVSYFLEHRTPEQGKYEGGKEKKGRGDGLSGAHLPVPI